MFDLKSYRDRAFIEARVQRVVRVPELGECWDWTRARSSRRYGSLTVTANGRPWALKAHRVAYEIFVGSIPSGMHVLHRCDNPPCCNPAHLFVGSHLDNMEDMARKGRVVCGRKTKHHNVKLTEKDVREIRSIAKYHGINRDLARRFGVSDQQIYTIRSGKQWRDLRAE